MAYEYDQGTHAGGQTPACMHPKEDLASCDESPLYPAEARRGAARRLCQPATEGHAGHTFSFLTTLADFTAPRSSMTRCCPGRWFLWNMIPRCRCSSIDGPPPLLVHLEAPRPSAQGAARTAPDAALHSNGRHVLAGENKKERGIDMDSVLVERAT